MPSRSTSQLYDIWVIKNRSTNCYDHSEHSCKISGKQPKFSQWELDVIILSCYNRKIAIFNENLSTLRLRSIKSSGPPWRGLYRERNDAKPTKPVARNRQSTWSVIENCNWLIASRQNRTARGQFRDGYFMVINHPIII